MTSSSPSLSLAADHVFGMTGSSVHMVDRRTVAYASSNSISFVDAKSGAHSLVWGLGLAVGAIATHRERNVVAFAEKGVQPAVYVVSYPDQEVLATLRGSAELDISSLAFSRDGKFLAALGGLPDFSLCVWDWENETSLVEPVRIDGEKCPGVGAVSFSPLNPRTLCVTGSFDDEGRAILLHLIPHFDSHLIQTTQLAMADLVKDGVTSVTSHCWGLDGETLYLGTNNGNVLVAVIDPQSRELDVVARRNVYEEVVREVNAKKDRSGADLEGETARDSDMGMGDGGDGDGVEEGGESRNTTGKTDTEADNETDGSAETASLPEIAVKSLYLTRKGLVVCLESGDIAWLDASDHSLLGFLTLAGTDAGNGGDRLMSASFAPGLQVLAVATERKRVFVVTPATGLRHGHVHVHPNALTPTHSVSSVDDDHEQNGDAMRIRIEDSEVKLVVDFHSGAVTDVASIPHSNRLVTCGLDGTVRGWDFRTHRLAWKLDFGVPLVALAVSSDGALVAVGSEYGVLRILDSTASTAIKGKGKGRGIPRLICRIRLDSVALSKLAFDPLGNYLVVGTSGGKVLFVDARIDNAVAIAQAKAAQASDSTGIKIVTPASGKAASGPDLACRVAWRVLGSSELQGAVTDLAWDTDVDRGVYQVFASVLPGDLFRLEPPSLDHQPDASFRLANIDVRLALVKTESPPLAIALSPSKSTGGGGGGIDADDVERNRQVLFTALDNRTVSMYAYPEETGDPDLMDETDISPPVGTMAILDMPGSSIAVSPDEGLLVIGSTDGVVRIGPTHTHDFSNAPHQQLHDPWLGGVNRVAFSQDSTRVFSAGADGSVVVWFLNRKGGEPAAVVSDPLDESVLAVCPEVNDRIEVRGGGGGTGRSSGSLKGVAGTAEPEPDFIELHQRALKEAAVQRYADSKSKVVGDVDALRTRLRAMMEANKAETTPELERLEEADFVIDVDRREQIQRANAEKVTELRVGMERENIGRELVAERIKHECWDSMEVVGVTLKAFTADTNVSNYSLIRVDPAENALDEKLRTLRRVELAEFRSRHPMDAPTLLRQTHQAEPSRGIGMGRVGSRLGHQGSHMGSMRSETPDDYSRAGGTLSPMRDDDGYGDAAEGEEVELEDRDRDKDRDDLLYDTYELHTPRRKQMQIRFLRNLIREKKKAFNIEFDRYFDMKADEVSRINERNTRILQIIRELGVQKEEKVWEYLQDDDEHPENVLRAGSGQDTQRGRGRQDVAEEEDSSDRPRDDAMGRALRMMMGGKLEKRSEEQALDEELEKPEWMNKPVAQMNEEELEAVKVFEKKEALLNEERNKRRKALETELRKLQQQIQEYMDGFDERLARLYGLRLEADEAIHELQLRLVKLVQELLQERIMTAQEQELLTRQESLNVRKTSSTQRVADFRRELERLSTVFDRCAKEDKELERNFKRDFLDQPERIDVLYRLFRSRRRAPTVRMPGSVPGSAVDRDRGEDAGIDDSGAGSDDPFSEHDARAGAGRAVEQDPEAIERPNGWEDSVWFRLIDARSAKMQSEAAVRQAQQELAVAEAAFAELRKEDDALAGSIMTLGREINMFQKDRAEMRIDLHVLMRLKQGQVEVENTRGEVLSDFADAVLISQDIVHDLNAEIQRIGQDKLSLLEKLRTLRHAERLMKWELHKCDMEAEDLLVQIRDFQLLRVTKQLQLLIRGGGEDRGTEIAALEKRRAQARAAHEHRQEEATRQLKRVRRRIGDLQVQNSDLIGEISELEAAVNERQRINRIQQAGGAHGAGGRTGQERFRDVANMRRMHDIVKAQREELAALKSELRRLRLRAFPTFAKEKHVTDGL